ncbi:MAG: hypothetical protein HOG05_05395 [Bacteroidetes bacterium]|nr:hypothetical protein [Bacteroidota bacterium]
MENFQVGDQVEFIDDNTVGTVVSILDNKQLIISIEGLEIPVYKSQLIRISKGPVKATNLAEKYKDDLTQVNSFTHKSEATNKGLFIALSTGQKPETFQFQLINDTKNQIYFTFYSQINNAQSALSHGHLKAYSDTALITYDQLGSVKFPTYTICILPFNEYATKIDESFSYSFSPSGKELMKKQEKAPLVDYHAWLYEIEKQEATSTAPIQIIESEPEAIIDVDRPDNIIDLHIDKIEPNFDILARDEIFQIQFNYFIKEFEKMIAFDYENIIIIHGIGINTLKEKIRKYLNGNKYVLHYKDANVREYGYGATEIFLKN